MADKKVEVFLWHVPQSADVARCDGDLVTTPKPEYWPPWQFAHPLVMPVWLMAQIVKLVVLVWQLSHAVGVGGISGMCAAADVGLLTTPAY